MGTGLRLGRQPCHLEGHPCPLCGWPAAWPVLEMWAGGQAGQPLLLHHLLPLRQAEQSWGLWEGQVPLVLLVLVLFLKGNTLGSSPLFFRTITIHLHPKYSYSLWNPVTWH